MPAPAIIVDSIEESTQYNRTHMPKMKTNKTVAKRFQVKRSKKKGVSILKRTDGQDHFNAREKGKTRRNKRRDNTMSATVKKNLMRFMPHA